MTLVEPAATESGDPRRMWIPKTHPAVYKALVALQRASSADLDPTLGELIKIRASQLNGCAYCLHMHTKDSIELGIDQLKLGLIAAWEESTGVFTDVERAVLGLTDAITRISDAGVPDEVFDAAAAVLDAQTLGQVVASIAMINTWNRIAIAGNYPTGLDERSLR